jgi:hypothetical protein
MKKDPVSDTFTKIASNVMSNWLDKYDAYNPLDQAVLCKMLELISLKLIRSTTLDHKLTEKVLASKLEDLLNGFYWLAESVIFCPEADLTDRPAVRYGDLEHILGDDEEDFHEGNYSDCYD